jgi:hypothetical protein
MYSAPDPLFLVWSEEHGAWWKPGSSGYTRSVLEAGRYSFKEAIQIVGDANRDGKVNEVAMFAILLNP